MPARLQTGVRTSQPSGHDPYARGGIGNVVRRGVDPLIDLSTQEGVARLYEGNGLRLLKVLPDVHPMFDKELWNVLNLACAPGDLSVSAVVDDGNGEEVDDEATASLKAVFQNLPAEIGGMAGLARQLTQEAMLTGLPCLEAVPGPTGSGLVGIFPVDSLTVGFRREADYSLVPRQRQNRASGHSWVDLDLRTFFWRAMNPMVDNPYGRPPLGVALHACLGDIAMIADLKRAIHLVGHPRLDQSFDFQESVNFAVLTLKMKPTEANEWAFKQFLRARQLATELRTDDVLLHDKNIETKVLEGGAGFAGLEPILAFLRHNVIVALKSMPTLMGVNDGSTQTYTTVEWAIYASGLESARGLVAELLWQAASLHFRLIGSKARPKVKTKPIRTTDNMVEAQTEAIKIRNERIKYDDGLIGPEDYSRNVTGSAPYDLAKLKARPALDAAARQGSTTGETAATVRFGRAGEPAKRVQA